MAEHTPVDKVQLLADYCIIHDEEAPKDLKAEAYNRFGEALISLSRIVLTGSRFVHYSDDYKTEMESASIEKMLQVSLEGRFDPTRSSEILSWLWRVCHNASLVAVQKLNRETERRADFAAITEMFSPTEEGEFE